MRGVNRTDRYLFVYFTRETSSRHVARRSLRIGTRPRTNCERTGRPVRSAVPSRGGPSFSRERSSYGATAGRCSAVAMPFTRARGCGPAALLPSVYVSYWEGRAMHGGVRAFLRLSPRGPRPGPARPSARSLAHSSRMEGCRNTNGKSMAAALTSSGGVQGQTPFVRAGTVCATRVCAPMRIAAGPAMHRAFL